MSAHLGLVLHVQQGNNSPYGWFAGGSGGNGVSSTWWVGKAGQIEQYVDSALTAYAQGAGNPTYNSVETEGFDYEALTPAQISGVAQIYAWGMRTYAWPAELADAPGNQGLGTHGMGGAAWGNHPGCPGAIRASQRQLILDEVAPAPISTQEEYCMIAGTPSGKGYYVAEAGGQVFAFGDAKYVGGINWANWPQEPAQSALVPGDTCNGIAVCATGGYWLSTVGKRVYGFGGAPQLGNPS
jgi:hypothetical protein